MNRQAVKSTIVVNFPMFDGGDKQRCNTHEIDRSLSKALTQKRTAELIVSSGRKAKTFEKVERKQSA